MINLAQSILPFAFTIEKDSSEFNSAFIVAVTPEDWMVYFIRPIGNGAWAQAPVSVNGADFHCKAFLSQRGGITNVTQCYVGPVDARAHEIYREHSNTINFTCSERVLSAFKEWSKENPETFQVMTGECTANIKAIENLAILIQENNGNVG